MGRPGYKRTSTRCQYGQSALEGALLAIKDGASMKSVAAKFGISRKTLRRHRDGLVQTPGVIKLGSFRPVLPLEIENELVIHLLDMQSRFFGLSGQDVRKLAFELVTNNNIEHRFDLQGRWQAGSGCNASSVAIQNSRFANQRPQAWQELLASTVRK